MNNKEWDKKLNISTTNERDWQLSIVNYHRLESTDYEVLELIGDQLELHETDQFVDMGCGTGRALFYIHQRFNTSVVGIELHPVTFDELERNRLNYTNHFGYSESEIQLIHNYADQYEIQAEDSVFYFFNPFSPQIYKKIIYNILNSKSTYPRDITLILYYPERKTLDFIVNDTEFILINTIKIPGTKDSRDYVFIFKLEA